jgi:hypothetical protein
MMSFIVNISKFLVFKPTFISLMKNTQSWTPKLLNVYLDMVNLLELKVTIFII